MKNIITIIAVLFFGVAPAQNVLTLLHTNDTHSCIEPESNGGAGVVNRSVIVDALRDSLGGDNVLLFDCGDFSQGSLYYNAYRGTTEVECMNAMRYDVAAIGNHEFDFGLDNLARLVALAKFPFVCANYDFTGTACEGLVKPYVVIERAGVKVGVFGLSPDPAGLVPQNCYEGVRFSSPVDAARLAVEALEKEGCSVIVCLSHLGWKIPNEYNDERLVAETEGIDVVLGGHSHDLFEQPLIYSNSAGENVLLNQAGKNGRCVGFVSVALE